MPELHDAVSTGNLEKLKCFINEGEDVNSKDDNGLKPLDIAIMNNNTEIIKFLLSEELERKIVVDADVWKYALIVQNHEIISYLMENFYYRFSCSKNSEGFEPVHYAVIYKYINMSNFHKLLCSDNINSITLNGYTPLHFAVVQNDINIMKILLDNGAEINARTVDGSSAIHLSVKHHSLMSLAILLKNSKVDVNDQVTSSKLTPLGIAVENNDEIIVKRLLETDAILNCKDKNGRTLLHIAVEQGNKNMVKLLLEKGLDVNALTKQKSTPLEIALVTKKEDIVRIILDYNPDITIKNKDGLSPLFIAIKYKCCSVELFSLQSDKAAVSNDSSSILHYALQYNNEYIINNLLEKDIKIFGKNIFGEHPLHVAIQYCNLNIISKLLSKCANVNLTTIDGSTPLHYAIKNHKQSEIVTFLLQHGADIEAKNNKNETPLNVGMKNYAHHKIIEILLKNGADPNHTSDDNNTPLYWFIVKGDIHNFEIPELLIGSGANVNKLNENNDNCLHTLYKNHCIMTRAGITEFYVQKGVDVNGLNKDCETALELCMQDIIYKTCDLSEIKCLIEAGALLKKNKNNETPLHLAIKYGYDDVVKYFLSLEAGIEFCPKGDQTLLHYAVQYCHKGDKPNTYQLETTIDHLLVQEAWMIDREDKKGRTPLHTAVSKGLIGIVKKLLDKIADINSPHNKEYSAFYYTIKAQSVDKKGRTPLHIAVSKGFLTIVKELLDRKADINALDKKKYSPLHYAIETQNIDMVKLLVKNGALMTYDAETLSVFDLAAQTNKHIYKILLNS